jgi:hypothetical protein
MDFALLTTAMVYNNAQCGGLTRTISSYFTHLNDADSGVIGRRFAQCPTSAITSCALIREVREVPILLMR